MTANTYIRFEKPDTLRDSFPGESCCTHDFGPYDWVQVTYKTVNIGLYGVYNDMVLATFSEDDRMWMLNIEIAKQEFAVGRALENSEYGTKLSDKGYSDFIVYSGKDRLDRLNELLAATPVKKNPLDD